MIRTRQAAPAPGALRLLAAIGLLLAAFTLGACAKDPAPCAGSATLCAGSCVNLASDNRNCGGCGIACASGEACTAGTCLLTCPAGLVPCDGACTDPLTDPAHCGATGSCAGAEAGVPCAAWESCVSGVCSSSCAAGWTRCDATCVDLQSDANHCGACATPCPAGEVCLLGGCTPACGSGQVRCGLACVVLATDPLHCGDCAIACDPGFGCELGSCQRICAPPTTRCGSGLAASCADLAYDATHCGSCTIACDPGRSCDAGACSSPSCAGLLGLPGSPYSSSGGSALAFALADFDGDGRLDAAVLHDAPPTVALLRGDGSGAFALRAVIDVPAGTSAIAAGDLDRDGKADLLLGSSSPLTTAVLGWYGDGAWGFLAGAAVGLAASAGPRALTLADLDGDGALDLVLGTGPDAVGANLFIYLNDGLGNLGAPGAGATRVPSSGFTVTAGIRVVGVAELTGDTALDLLLLADGTGAGTGRAELLQGMGAGTFAPLASYAVASDATGIAFADFDGLGRTDWVATHATNQLTVFLSLAGGYDLFSRYDALSPRGVVAGDFDLDGLVDLVTADALADSLSFRRNPGIGGGVPFSPAVPMPVGPFPVGLELRTLGPSALPFLVALGADGHLVALPVLPPLSGGPFGAPLLHDAGGGTALVAAGRLDADARTDALTVDPLAAAVQVWTQGATPGRFVAGPAFPALPAASAPSAVVLAPLDADGTLDAAVSLSAVGELRLFANLSGTASFTDLRAIAVGGTPAALVAADLDGDGVFDLAVADSAADRIALLFAPGAATPGATATLATGAGPAGLLAADLRGAGCLDLLSADATAGTLTLHPCDPASPGSFLPAATLPACAGARAAVAGDLDGDGLMDLAVLCAGGGAWLRNLGGGLFGAGGSFDGGPDPASIAMADLDGDGRLDLVLANPSTGAVALVRGAPGGALSPPWFYPAGGAPRAAVVADLDATGAPDLLVASGVQPGLLVGAGLVALRSACLP